MEALSITVDWHKKTTSFSKQDLLWQDTTNIKSTSNEHPETELSFLLTFRFSKIERPLEKDLKCMSLRELTLQSLALFSFKLFHFL